ncbi:MAG TPA: hypothetical protein VGX68_03880 [Thermoanaerobaculia bacterium]|nr:hypothetical protein [Thermoanaerobaculia bacterium]
MIAEEDLFEVDPLKFHRCPVEGFDPLLEEGVDFLHHPAKGILLTFLHQSDGFGDPVLKGKPELERVELVVGFVGAAEPVPQVLIARYDIGFQ